MGLILGRSKEQGFFIGPDIHVKVLSHRGGVTRLYIEAPSDVIIARDELKEVMFAKAKLEKEQAECPQPPRDDTSHSPDPCLTQKNGGACESTTLNE